MSTYYNEDGYDRDGYDEDGYDRDGYDEDGYDRDGYDEDGYDENGYDEDGRDREGYDHEGFDSEGNPYVSANDSIVEFIISENGIAVTVFFPEVEVINVSKDHPKHEELLKFFVRALQEGRSVTYGEFMIEYTRHIKINGELRELADGLVYNVTTEEVYHHFDKRTDALSAYIAELAKNNDPQAKAFAKFANRLANNPSERSQNELFNWFIGLVNKGEKLTITHDGMLVAYKGVQMIDGVPHSIMSGPGIINSGEIIIEHDHLPNRIGSVVEVQRSYVESNENVGCGRGLHAGTFSYAHSWGRGHVLQIELDPAHVVSIPKCSSYQKLRCHKYRVVDYIYEPIEEAVIAGSNYNWEVEDFAKWVDAGYDVTDAKTYIEDGLSVDNAILYHENGGLADMSEWENAGYSMVEATEYIAQGLTLDDVLSSSENFEEPADDESEVSEEDESQETVEDQTPEVIVVKKHKKKNRNKKKRRK